MEEASMRFLLSIFCQSFTQAGFYYLMSSMLSGVGRNLLSSTLRLTLGSQCEGNWKRLTV